MHSRHGHGQGTNSPRPAHKARRHSRRDTASLLDDDKMRDNVRRQRDAPSPVQLPRLDSPHVHNRLQRRPQLRGSKYKVVPPLSADGDDSWGEDADSEDASYPSSSHEPEAIGRHVRKKVHYRSTPIRGAAYDYIRAVDHHPPSASQQASAYLKDQPAFAQHYVDDFITDYLESELILDLLISVIKQPDTNSCTELPVDSRPDQKDDAAPHALAQRLLQQLLREEVASSTKNIAEESLLDRQLSRLVSEQLTAPVVRQGCRDVASEVLQQHTDAHRQAGVAMVKDCAERRLLDSLALDHLLASLPRDDVKDEPSQTADKLLDGSILTVLLQQYMEVGRKREGTATNWPLRRLHERTVADLATEQLLGELCASLDEDMADLDEYEQGLPNSHSETS